MKLGLSSDATSDVWTASRWLDSAPMGTVVRNGCEHTEAPLQGVYYIKVQSKRDDCGYEWAWYDPRTCAYRRARTRPVRSADVFLPVQVMKRGDT